VVAVLTEQKKDWVSLLKKNRKLETASFTLRDERGQKVALEGPHIKVEDLVPRIPHNAYRCVQIKDTPYWSFAFNVRVPGLGQVRLVSSFENQDLTGTDAVLITNRTDWSAKKIIQTYLQRWPIEICQTQPIKMAWCPLRLFRPAIGRLRGRFKREDEMDVNFFPRDDDFFDQTLSDGLALFERKPFEIVAQ
jgi:hypothetical protein